MHSIKRVVLVTIGVGVLLMYAGGPAFSHTITVGGEPSGHNCGAVPGQTNPPHSTHRHAHPRKPGSIHHKKRHHGPHTHFHNHQCYPPPASTAARVRSTAARFAQPQEDRGGVTVGMLLLAGFGLLAVVVLAKPYRRRLRER